jgi:3-oxoacyl-[acyl-carrier-protein] synthase II
MTRRIAITGMGVVSPVAQGLAQFDAALRTGRSGIRANHWHETHGARSQLVGHVDPFELTVDMGSLARRHLSRADQFALAAANEAWQHAALGPTNNGHERFGIVLGSGGGVANTEAYVAHTIRQLPQRPSRLLAMSPDNAGSAIAWHYKLHGPRSSIMTACSSGATAIGYAADFIQTGFADAMLAGGTESLSHVTFTGFNALGALATGSNRPFDARRDGIVLGEGAAVLVLESFEFATARGARILAELVGYGLTSDANHITAPHPEGAGMARAIDAALRRANLKPEQIGYINAHGTGTELNDKSETTAIKRAFGDAAYTTPMSSIKPMVGHTLSAAGAIESVATILGLRGQYLPPTLNYGTPDPLCDLDYVPNTARQASFEFAMKNSLAFGGNNTSLIFKRHEH